VKVDLSDVDHLSPPSSPTRTTSPMILRSSETIPSSSLSSPELLVGGSVGKDVTSPLRNEKEVIFLSFLLIIKPYLFFRFLMLIF